MRISTITNWAYSVTLLLTGLSAAAFLMSAKAATDERAAVEQHLTFSSLAETLSLGTEQLSDEARLFAVRGEARHLKAYLYEAHEVRSRDRALQRVRLAGASPAELAAIAEAELALAELNQLEGRAVEVAKSGDLAAARTILFGPDHERTQTRVLTALGHFESLTSSRTESEKLRAAQISDHAALIAKVMLTLTALVFLAVLYFVLRRRVAVPLRRMTGIVMRLAKQDYAVEVPDALRHDEIGDMTQAIQVFRTNGLERDRLEAERTADLQAKDGILQMMQRLQACMSLEELSEVVTCFAPQVFPDLAGRLYVFDDSRNALSELGAWLHPQQSGVSFPPNACWGLRRGRPHHGNGVHNDVCCPHIDSADVISLCVPLTAQGEVIGLLYFEEAGRLTTRQDVGRLYLELVSDNIALAMASLRLRERLANLAVRDSLTGLLNRRSLDAELASLDCAPDAGTACLMIDVDHFKRFNDDFGHDAGDAVLQHVARTLAETGDGACAYRFGGEEFTLLIPGADESEAFEVAERLRARVAEGRLAHHGKALGQITISLGVAVCPDDGSAATVLRRADAALLHAKSMGRNRTAIASGLSEDESPARHRSAR